MRIRSVEIFRVSMPLVYPFRTAFSDEEHIESLLVRLVGDEGYGWGESSPWRAPAYSNEWAGGAFRVVRDWLAPQLVGRSISTGSGLQQALAGIKGNYFAKACLDLAWWDLAARSAGQPLWQYIGGLGPTVRVGADLGVMETLDALLDEIEKAHSAGFERVKLKFRPGWEVNMVQPVRQAFPNMVFHIDCNSAYTLGHLPMFKALDEYDLAMIEQPLAHDDLIDHAQLQQKIRTPICLDESIVSLAKARKALALKACGWVNLKLGRLGGLTNALAVHDVCQDAGVPCWVGGMLESAVGQAHNLALATLANIKYPSDIFPTSRFYDEDLGEPPIALSGPAKMTLSRQPGIAVEPHQQRLERRLIEKAFVN